MSRVVFCRKVGRCWVMQVQGQTPLLYACWKQGLVRPRYYPLPPDRRILRYEMSAPTALEILRACENGAQVYAEVSRTGIYQEDCYVV